VPSTVSQLLGAADLEPEGVVSWGEPVPESATGVYIVTLTDDVADTTSARSNPLFDSARVKHLLDVRCELKLDGTRPSAAELSERLETFWLPDEVVLYVGLAGQPLRKRVSQYYRTPLGARRPHAGGWWLKTLRIEPLWVHYAATSDYEVAERALLRAFAEAVSLKSRAALHDRERVAPFANLRDGHDLIKRHGITGATGDVGKESDSERSQPGTRTQPRWQQALLSPARQRHAPGRSASTTMSQTITVADKAAGRIRFPRAAKRFFPSDRTQVEVAVRGRLMSARWDPRTGPDRDRSGVLSFGRGNLEGLVLSGEALAVSRRTDGQVTLD
jgi:hypothetical protein